MRPPKIAREVVYWKVWESLCARMDPETHIVRPSWRKMMQEIGVCRQRIADAVRHLRDQGKIRSFAEPIPGSDGKFFHFYYEILQDKAASTDGDAAGS